MIAKTQGTRVFSLHRWYSLLPSIPSKNISFTGGKPMISGSMLGKKTSPFQLSFRLQESNHLIANQQAAIGRRPCQQVSYSQPHPVEQTKHPRLQDSKEIDIDKWYRIHKWQRVIQRYAEIYAGLPWFSFMERIPTEWIWKVCKVWKCDLTPW